MFVSWKGILSPVQPNQIIRFIPTSFQFRHLKNGGFTSHEINFSLQNIICDSHVLHQLWHKIASKTYFRVRIFYESGALHIASGFCSWSYHGTKIPWFLQKLVVNKDGVSLWGPDGKITYRNQCTSCAEYKSLQQGHPCSLNLDRLWPRRWGYWLWYNRCG